MLKNIENTSYYVKQLLLIPKNQLRMVQTTTSKNCSTTLLQISYKITYLLILNHLLHKNIKSTELAHLWIPFPTELYLLKQKLHTTSNVESEFQPPILDSQTGKVSMSFFALAAVQQDSIIQMLRFKLQRNFEPALKFRCRIGYVGIISKTRFVNGYFFFTSMSHVA